MLQKSLFSIFNLLVLLLFLPFGFFAILPDEGSGALLGYALSIFGLSLTNHFFGIYIKKNLNDYPNLIIVILAFFLLVSVVEYFGIFEFSIVSSWLFQTFLNTPWVGAIPIVLAAILYRLNFRYLFNNTYPEEIANAKKGKSKISGDFHALVEKAK